MYLSKEEKARRIRDLYYNQGKTYHEIVKELKVSPNFINAVLKKHEEQENKTSREVASFKLFSEGKNTIEVAIQLKLSDEEVTQFYNGFFKLKGLYKFGIIYEEHRHHIPRLLKLCSEAQKEGINTGQLVKLSELANENNPVGLTQLEKLRIWHLNEIRGMETELHRMKAEKEKYENVLFLLKSEISTFKDQCEYYRESCERERIELEKIKKEKERIDESLRLGDIAE
jgi:hypothetical protein